MKPVLPDVVQRAREHREKLEKMKGLRPGWLCPKCGSAHSPTTDTCPRDRDRQPIRDIIR